MTKQELLSLLTETPCKDGLDAFMAFDGSAEEYFLHHKRGEAAFAWCISHFCKGTTLTLPNVQNVGYISIYEGSTLTLPKVQEVGDIVLFNGATLTLPQAQSVGYIRLLEGSTATLPNVQNVGYISLYEGSTLIIPKEAVIKKTVFADGKIIRI